MGKTLPMKENERLQVMQEVMDREKMVETVR